MKQKLEPESAYELIPSLPDDVALNCLARVPRSHHPTLALVSKPIRSLLSSPLFFNTRSQLHATELLLYINICSSDDEGGLQWFTLSRNPNVVVPVRVPPIPSPSTGAAYAVVGPNIYVIGGLICKIPSPQVWVLDCRFNQWRRGPTMLAGRKNAVASVVDGKIHVIGGCVPGSTILAEVLDLGYGRWVEEPSPFAFDLWGLMDDNVSEVAFDPRNILDIMIYLRRWQRGACVVMNGILYCCWVSGKIRGLDMRRGVWKELKCLDDGLPNIWGRWATLAYACEKLLVFWGRQRRENGEEKSEICCAEIEVNEDGDGELWAKVCWCQNILSVPQLSFVIQCSSVVL